MERMLQAVGLTELEECVYRALLARPRASLAEMRSATSLATGQARDALAALERKGLASRTPGKPPRFIPAPPDVAIEGLIHRRRVELDEARLSALKLVEEFREALERTSPAEVVEVVTESEALYERYVQLQRGAKEEVLALDKPPYVCPPGVNQDELDGLSRGVAYRAVYDRKALEVPGQPECLHEHVQAGEQARVIADVPVKLAIADRRLALVPLSARESRARGAVLVHSSTMLDALTGLFETLWELAVPATFPSALERSKNGKKAGLSPEDERVLALVAAGFKDEAIASQLGIGLRTVRRRINRMMKALGATTRFQAGLQAARRGWL